MATPLIEFKHVTKTFGATVANDNLSLSISEGTIHALVGENGAGKSTAMKLLFGTEDPTSGEILIRGERRPWRSPRGALAHGVGMVHQHFMLSSPHSALENVILGREVTPPVGFLRALWPIQRAKLKSKLTILAAESGFTIPWNTQVSDLSVGLQQQLEILKLMYAGVKVMIFDEPTAVLTPEETNRFLGMLLRLKAQGKTIILITHKLKEVRSVADRVSILRRGTCVAEDSMRVLNIQKIADLMVGRHVQLGDSEHMEIEPGRPIMRMSHVSLKDKAGKLKLRDVSLAVHEGQVIGIAGVEGSGQAEIVQIISDPSSVFFGKDTADGNIQLFGQDAKEWTNEDVRMSSFGIVPSDRLQEAVLVEETLLENDLLGHDNEFVREPEVRFLSGLRNALRRIDRGMVVKKLNAAMEDFDVRPRDPSASMSDLSGGNQQKFVMARELSRNPRLIVASHPTRGVDIGSIEQIHRNLLKRREDGAGVLLVSSQLDELMALSDVIVVMFEGAIKAIFTREQFDEGQIGVAMGGANADER